MLFVLVKVRLALSVYVVYSLHGNRTVGQFC